MWDVCVGVVTSSVLSCFSFFLERRGNPRKHSPLETGTCADFSDARLDCLAPLMLDWPLERSERVAQGSVELQPTLTHCQLGPVRATLLISASALDPVSYGHQCTTFGSRGRNRRVPVV